MGIREWRGRVGRSVIVDAVSEMCRTRSVTHILMSSDTFKAYSSGITTHHVRSGIRRGTCHSVGILVVDGMRDDIMFTFNHRRAKIAKRLLRLIREEQYEDAMDLLDAIMERGGKWIHVGQTPGLPDEGDEE
jgi:hypothetical protein